MFLQVKLKRRKSSVIIRPGQKGKHKKSVFTKILLVIHHLWLNVQLHTWHNEMKHDVHADCEKNEGEYET